TAKCLITLSSLQWLTIANNDGERRLVQSAIVQPQHGASINVQRGCIMLGVETALLFCAIRAAEMLSTLPYARDTRAGYEIGLCMRRIGFRLSASFGDTELCVNAPALVLDGVKHPRRFGSVASCYTGAFVKETPHKVRNKDQGRLHAGEE